MTDFAAIILAGERAKHDALRDHCGVDCKALIEMGGAPMIRRVIDALDGASSVTSIHLSGPAESCVRSDAGLARMIADQRITWRPPAASPSTSAHQMLTSLPESRPVMITTADHPMLTSGIVDHFCVESAASGCDVVVGLAPYDLVRTAYPDLKKTVLQFRDGGYCGCNLFAFPTAEGRRVADFWRRVEQHRKKPLMVIRMLGLWTLLRYRLGRLSLEGALKRLSRRVGLRVGVVILPYAQAPVDVDSVDDFQRVRQHFKEGRQAPETSGAAVGPPAPRSPQAEV
jgi:CTP:molybdopterin cytidylyltransferase MocA